ncbi:hypothetical protein EON64_02755 [archaeon]|nr:MAG: hypothetical protein EON64_02755 [archaeon]
MDEADKYLADMEEKLKKLASTTTSSSATIEDKLLLCKRQYEYGQLLCSLSKYKEAYSYFSDAWTFLQSYRDDEVYSTLYYSMSTQFASLLDYLGMSQQCEKLYEELSTLNPHGWHVGDLAFYLHRRKRDYDQAER